MLFCHCKGGESGAVTLNTISISDSGEVLGSVYAGRSNTGNATENHIIISNGTVSQHLYGGYVNSGSGIANANLVDISGGEVGTNTGHGVYGGYINTGSGDATYNIVTVSNGTVKSSVFGGYNNTGVGEVTINKVNISGNCEVLGSVVGGRSNRQNAAFHERVNA